jgi:hypothetical protein
LGRVKSSGTLPQTGVMASTFSSGERKARKIAMASSMPGSVSMMMRRGLAGAAARTESFEVAAFDVTLTDEDFAPVCEPSSLANSRAEAGNWVANPPMAPAIAMPVELAKNLRRLHGACFISLDATLLQFPCVCDFSSACDSRFMVLLPRSRKMVRRDSSAPRKLAHRTK